MAKIIGKALPNIPWEDKPAGEIMPMWRFSGNPIIDRHGNKRSNSVFNSAVVPFEDGFAGVFRCDSHSISMDLFAGPAARTASIGRSTMNPSTWWTLIPRY